MFEIRPFRNSDPPLIAEVWRSQPPQRGLAQPINATLLELCVFSKQYFDPEGFLVATQGDQMVGFVHAGFGPSDDGADLDTTLGTTHLLMLRGDRQDEGLADELIARSEAYQRDHGATVHYAGGLRPLDGFYLGLYGGSELPGILDSDPCQAQHFLRNDYTEASQVIVVQRELSRSRLGGPRDTRKVKRETLIEPVLHPAARNWWEACVTGGHDRLRFSLLDRATNEQIAHVTYWDVEPLASAWGIPTVGMIDLWVEPDRRRSKVATHLLSESLRQVQRRGALVVEAQTMAENAAGISLYKALGFTQVDTGRILRRGPSQ